MRRIGVCFLTGFLLPSFTEPESRHCEFWQLPINAEGRGIGKAVNKKLIESENKSVTFFDLVVFLSVQYGYKSGGQRGEKE